MQFELEVIGEQLYKVLIDKATELNTAMQHLCRYTDAVFPSVVRLVKRPHVNDLLLQPGVVRVLLVEAYDLNMIEAIQVLERKELAFLNFTNNTLPRLAPMIAVFESPAVLSEIRDLPELISDWTFLPLDPNELARRIHSTLKRKNTKDQAALRCAFCHRGDPDTGLLWKHNAVDALGVCLGRPVPKPDGYCDSTCGPGPPVSFDWQVDHREQYPRHRIPASTEARDAYKRPVHRDERV
nr:hypothetical protein [uncultured Noviherbaspirillum sp.]